MPEWSKGVVSSTTIFECAGSNPALCMSPWLNWIQRVTSNHKIAGSSPVGDCFVSSVG